MEKLMNMLSENPEIVYLALLIVAGVLARRGWITGAFRKRIEEMLINGKSPDVISSETRATFDEATRVMMALDEKEKIKAGEVQDTAKKKIQRSFRKIFKSFILGKL